jgi:hypothetical protein
MPLICQASCDIYAHEMEVNKAKAHRTWVIVLNMMS